MHDNLDCWFRAAATEHYEILDDEDKKTFKERYMVNSDELQDWCEGQMLHLIGGSSHQYSMFVSAIIGSVDWPQLFADVTKDIEDEDAADLRLKTDEKKCFWCNARGVDYFNGKEWIHKDCE
jgi:hypothetical protein